jgi:hypothetical protein
MTLDDLARRAVACKGWRWMPGMLATDESRLYRVQDDGTALDIEDTIVERGWGFGLVNMLPDLTDPATMGCLLALVREAWEPHRGADYIASTMHTGSGWGVGARYGSEGVAAIVLPTYETEAEALVAALEAAPSAA